MSEDAGNSDQPVANAALVAGASGGIGRAI